jgi:hypothetical protein
VLDVDFDPDGCGDGDVLLYGHVPKARGCCAETTNAISAYRFQSSGPGPRRGFGLLLLAASQPVGELAGSLGLWRFSIFDFNL